MKVTLESTDKIVHLKTPSGLVPARIWEGTTESGIAVHAFITRVAVHKDLDQTQFERELLEKHAALSPALQGVYDARLLVI
jgi:hypothetical protein